MQEHGKTLVVKALEQLAADGKIIEKVYGKQKVYLADQSKFAVVSDVELKSMDDEITKLTKELDECQKSVKGLETQHNGMGSSLTTQDAQSQLDQTNKKITKLEAKLKDFESNENVMDPEEKASICDSFDRNVKEWRKRKRVAREILDSILEGYPKSKKILFEEIGIETDEDVNAVMPSS